MSWFSGTEYYEDGPDVDLYNAGKNELDDLQAGILNASHNTSSFSHPIIMRSPKGEIVKAYKEQLEEYAARGYEVVGRGTGLSETGLFKGKEDLSPEEEAEVKRLLGETSISMNSSAHPLSERFTEAAPAACKIASNMKCLRDANHIVKCVNIGARTRIEDLSDEEIQQLQEYTARAVNLWLTLHAKKEYARKGLRGLKKRANVILKNTRSDRAKREQRYAEKHRRLATKGREYMRYLEGRGSGVPALPERDITERLNLKSILDHATMDRSVELHLVTPQDKDIYHIGCAKRFYKNLYSLDDDQYNERQLQAMEFFKDFTGLDFVNKGISRDEDEKRKGTLCLFKSKIDSKPYAILQNYLVNTKLDHSVVHSDSSFGENIRDGNISEAGWVVTITTEKGVSLEGAMSGKVARVGEPFFFSDIYIDAINAYGDEGLGSPVGVHIESKNVASYINGGESLEAPLIACRCVSNGDTIAVSIKDAKRHISESGMKTSMLL